MGPLSAPIFGISAHTSSARAVHGFSRLVKPSTNRFPNLEEPNV